MKQAVAAARLAGADDKTRQNVRALIAQTLPQIPVTASPPEIGRIIYQCVEQLTGVRDPYRDIKIKSNRLALGIYAVLKDKIAHARDPLLAAVELAIAGNIIDYGAKHQLDIRDELENILRQESCSRTHESATLFNYPGFAAAASAAKDILYLADNAGETVFDRVLMEEIRRCYPAAKIIYAVKGAPVINDALAEDATACGIDAVATIINSGADTPGTVLTRCTRTFVTLFSQADMVISKGQGNFEALSSSSRPVFFLLMAKCAVIAEHISDRGIPCTVGDVVLYHHHGR